MLLATNGDLKQLQKEGYFITHSKTFLLLLAHNDELM
jgi:hypothetical protein